MHKSFTLAALGFYFSLVLAFLFSAPNLSATGHQLAVTYHFDSPAIRSEDGKAGVIMDGLPSLGNPGQPILPVKTAYILLPPGQHVAGAEVFTPWKHTLSGTFSIPPGQRQVPPSSSEIWRPTQEDAKIYGSFSPFPPEKHRLVGVWSLCGYRIAVLNLYPVEYIPQTGTISYFPQMELRLQTADSPHVLAETQNMTRSPELMAPRLAHLVDNPDRIDQYREAAAAPEALKGSLVDSTGAYPYVIVTDQELASTFQILADFKTRRGQRAVVATVEEISSHYPGSDLPEQIRNFIYDVYTHRQTDFVLLGGDDEIIPHRGLYGQAFGYEEDDIPSDLYFGALDGNWNTDGDALWGEPGEEDLLPEVCVGRAPVDNQTEALQFVNKTMQYQQSPVVHQTTSALMAGEILWDIPPTYGGDYKDEIRFGASTNGFITQGFPAGFTVSTLYDRDLELPWWGGTILNLMNGGLNLINHVGHTSVERALRLTADRVLSDLSNDGMNGSYFVIFSQGCYAASFDNRNPSGSYLDDCVAEAFVAGPHGAVAFVGNTRYGWATAGLTDAASQYFDRQFFDALFGEGIHRLGSANDDSKMDNIWAIDFEGTRWCYYQQTLLGDPELDVWTEIPETLTVLHPKAVPMGDTTNFLVRVKSGPNAVADALICIQQGQEIYQTRTTKNWGTAQFTLNPTTPETLHISVTAHNHIPYLGAMLSLADGPGPWYSRHLVDDDKYDGSWGNDDGLVNQGETIALALWLKNFGTELAEGVVATLATTDPYVEILDSIQSFPDIPPEGETVSEGQYLFAINGDCPDGHRIEFQVESHGESEDATEYTLTSTFSLDVLAPQLFFENLALSDAPPEGDGDGILEAGESAHLMVTVRNAGSAAAERTIGQLSSGADPYVQVDRGTLFFGTIGSDSAACSSWPYFIVTASDQSPPLYFMDYALTLVAAVNYAVQDSIPHAIGRTGLEDDMEDIETVWTHGGTGDLWHLDQNRFHTPFHAWYSGSSFHGRYQNEMDAFLMSPTIYLISGSHLSFWHWYDLEENHDFGCLEMFLGSGWTPISQPFTGNSQGWVREIHDLSTYPSGTALQVRFRMISDGQSSAEGWYVDDVYVGPQRRFILDQARVFPQQGDESTVFTFSAEYLSDLGYPPTSAMVYIDDIPHTLTAIDSNTAQIGTFAYQTTLSSGEHRHHFEFSSGLQTTRWPRCAESTGPVVVEAIYQEDFEEGDGGFSATGPDWEWGIPTSGPLEAHSGYKVWATVLDGEYSNNSDSRLETPPIDLSEVTYPRLSFWHWFNFEYPQAHYDGGNVKISVDGQDFQVITPQAGYEGTISNLNAAIPGEPAFCSYYGGQYWHQESFDLSPYSGHETVIRFHFGSDMTNTFLGWYIDDVVVSGLRSSPSLSPVTDLNLSLVGDAILLTWSWPHDQDVAEYVIHRGILSDGFRAEPESIASVVSTSFGDPSAVGDATTDYYYQVSTVSPTGKRSQLSNRVGVFDLVTRQRPSPPAVACQQRSVENQK